MLVMSDDVSVVAQLADVVEDAEVRSIDEFGRVSGDNPLLTTGFVSSKFSEVRLSSLVSFPPPRFLLPHSFQPPFSATTLQELC